jgi:hypothetical protein
MMWSPYRGYNQYQPRPEKCETTDCHNTDKAPMKVLNQNDAQTHKKAKILVVIIND